MVSITLDWQKGEGCTLPASSEKGLLCNSGSDREFSGEPHFDAGNCLSLHLSPHCHQLGMPLKPKPT